jgi:YidC/Oxa1 family membrane protein insertase
MDKKTILGVVLMSVIFIGYMVFNSRQQAEYQQYMEQVQAQEQALAAEQQAEEAAAAELSDSLKQVAADLAAQREKDIFGESLIAAKSGAEQTFTMANDLITVDFSTRGGMMTKAVLADYTKYAPKDERNELVSILDPESAMFDVEFYVKNGLNNVKVNTSEYVFASEGVRREADRQVLDMRLEVAPGAYIVYEYVLYNEQNPSRDYLIDFNVKLENLSPIMAQQATLGMMWSNRTYQNERSYKTENMYTTLSYRLPDEEDVEDLGMSEESKSKQVQSEVNWVAFRQQFFSQVFIAHNNFAYADMGFTTEEKGSGFLKHYTSRMGVNYTPQTTEYNFSIYCGPNKYPILQNVVAADGNGIALERLLPLGG